MNKQSLKLLNICLKLFQVIHITYKTLNICPYVNKKVLYNNFILQTYAACLENSFSQIDSLRFAASFVPRNFLLFIAEKKKFDKVFRKIKLLNNKVC